MANIAFLKTPAPVNLDGNQLNFRIAGKNAFVNGLLQQFYKLVLAPNPDPVDSDYPVSALETTDIVPADWTRANAGVCEMDLSFLFKTETKGHFTFPEPDAGLSFIQNIIKTFRLQVKERYGIPITDSALEYSETFRYMQGKLSDFRQGKLNYLGKTFTDLLQETGMFLTWAPLEKVTDIYAPERLYFLFFAAGNYKFKSKQYYTDGTSDEITHYNFTTANFEVRELLCSYYKLKTNNKKVIKYEVWIENDTTRISEVRTFVLDYRFQSYARYFMFKNSLGVYEVIRTTGKCTKVPDTQKEFATIPLPINFTHLDSAEKQISEVTLVEYTINSGFFTDKLTSDYFQEFVKSSDVYWLKLSTAYPVGIKPVKQPSQKDGEYNLQRDFILTHSLHDDFTEESVANQPIVIGDFSPDFNTDFFLGNVIYKNKALSKAFLRSNCPQGQSGTSVAYEVAADKYSSSISQADADAMAMAEADAFGQTQADLYGSCVIDNRIDPMEASIASFVNPSAFGTNDGEINIVVSKGLAPYSFAWNDGAITQNRNTLAGGNYSCVITDQLGNSITVTQTLVQPSQLFWNDTQIATFRRNCGDGYEGTLVDYQVDANTYSASTKEAANQLAINDINANGQNHADSVGTCIPLGNVDITITNNNNATLQLQIEDSQAHVIDLTNADSQVSIPVGMTYFYISGDFNYARIVSQNINEELVKNTFYHLNITSATSIWIV